MKQNNQMRRSRRNSLGRRPNNNSRQHFDSNGPNVRVRGSATQVNEKYTQLAKDAHSAGDHILAENYWQHAEHYYRILNTDVPANRFEEQKIAVEKPSELEKDLEAEITKSTENLDAKNQQELEKQIDVPFLMTEPLEASAKPKTVKKASNGRGKDE